VSSWRPSRLSSDFEALRELGNRQRRGREFEGLVQTLFEEAAFQVTRNARSARPRQTDLHARRGSDEYIVEVKWGQRAATIDHLRSFRDRLWSVPPRVGGVFFSMSGFGRTALRDVADVRQRDLLLFDGDEIDSLFGGELSLNDALRAKRRAYARDGRVLFMRGERRWMDQPKPDSGALPIAGTALWFRSQGQMPWFAGCGNFGPLVFTPELPDVDWTVAQGYGAGFDLHIHIETLTDLAHTMDLLRRTVGVSSSGTFMIQQAESAWFGFGSKGFLDAVHAQEERYSATPKGTRLHHTEQATYFDVCHDGLLTLTCDIRARRDRIDHCELSLQLHGIPLDLDPYHDLAEGLGATSLAYFRPLGTGSVSHIWPDPRERIQLVPLAYLRTIDDDDVISGIVVRNPFYNDSNRIIELGSGNEDVGDFANHLQLLDFLVCDLANYHEANASVDSYFLRHAEGVITSSAVVAHVVADWDKNVVR
jgi:hypothetical protein